MYRADAKSKTSIAAGYIQNTTELGLANKQLKAIQLWVDQQRKLYEKVK